MNYVTIEKRIGDLILRKLLMRYTDKNMKTRKKNLGYLGGSVG